METELLVAEKKMSLLGQIMELTDKSMVMDENCLLHQAVMLLADKWTLLVILSLLQGTKRTSDLLRQIDGISPKMLIKTLKKLESSGLVTRIVFPVVPPRVDYALTQSGTELKEVLSTLYSWAVKREMQSQGK